MGAGSYEESAEGGKGHLFIGKQKPASFEVLMATVKINPVAWNGFFTQKGKARQMDGSWRSELCSDPNFGLQNDLLHEWRRVWRLFRERKQDDSYPWHMTCFSTSQANGDSFRFFKITFSTFTHRNRCPTTLSTTIVRWMHAAPTLKLCISFFLQSPWREVEGRALIFSHLLRKTECVKWIIDNC